MSSLPLELVSPLAGPLKEKTGAPIYGCPVAVPKAQSSVITEAGADFGFAPDVNICGGGAVFEGPGWTLEAIATPGHTSNHICYGLKEENALFCGDHIMGWSTTVICPPDGDMGDYFRSLETIKARGFDTLWPTHGPPIREPGPFIDAYIAHRRAREAQILGALGGGYLGSRVGRRLPPLALRAFIILIGVVAIIKMVWFT